MAPTLILLSFNQAVSKPTENTVVRKRLAVSLPHGVLTVLTLPISALAHTDPKGPYFPSSFYMFT